MGFVNAPAALTFGGLDAGRFNFSGSVTCIGVALGYGVTVSGTLDTPYVFHGVTYPDFTLTVRDDGYAVHRGLAEQA
jgi:hypothetical protein